MSNGAECCALLICCPPAEARLALASKFVEHGCPEDAALACVDYLRAEFALAPKSFETTLLEIVRMSKTHHP
jgi:hypothetical protein